MTTREVDGAGRAGGLPDYYVYVLECEDGSLYSGITVDVERRMAEHLSQEAPGAKYTRAHRPVALVALWRTSGRSLASKLEYRLHRARRAQKLALVENPDAAGEDYVSLGEAERERYWKAALEPRA
ncbi:MULTISPECIES: GIY-YIG nuclease family protein [Atopobiaceae]|uniref:Endonuclease n=1 Tax=Parafannyhessea umbonata TaxID=604330 RepID=A0A1H9N573_9ACTN|nr:MULTISPECIES: GIY-YIG nuclease family protein [Atopobiaceae]SEH37722.1 putative endonuclease [Parafannyhessea umbonata]SER30917.1 putative endonuclease [Parafannyhessea umbonata]SJZ40123.1 putative endonuclease [Olsenella sp. KH1P3]